MADVVKLFDGISDVFKDKQKKLKNKLESGEDPSELYKRKFERKSILLHQPLAQTEEDAKRLNIFTQDGYKNVEEMRQKQEDIVTWVKDIL